MDTEKSSFQKVAKNLDSLNSEVLEQSYIVAASFENVTKYIIFLRLTEHNHIHDGLW